MKREKSRPICNTMIMPGCCGVGLLYEFHSSACRCGTMHEYLESLENKFCKDCHSAYLINYHINRLYTHYKVTLFIAYIIEEDADRNEFWLKVRKELVDNGFSSTYKFRNANSGNVVECLQLNTENRHYKDNHYKPYDDPNYDNPEDEEAEDSEQF